MTKAKELKDNSISVRGSVLNSTEKTVNKGQVIELKVRIPADQLDGKRDAFAKVLEGASFIKFTPSQTELDTDAADESGAQTDLDLEGK